jgi:hypothetical protein
MKSLYSKILEVQSKIGYVRKEKAGDMKFRIMPLQKTLSVCLPIMQELGLILLPGQTSNLWSQTNTKKMKDYEKLEYQATLTRSFTIADTESGESFSFQISSSAIAFDQHYGQSAETNALNKAYKVNQNKTGLARTAFEQALEQLVN